MARPNGTVTASGNYPDDTGYRVDSPATLILVSSGGALGGATAKLQAYQPEGALWVDLPNGSFTADTIKNIDVNSPTYIRLNVESYASDFYYSF